MVIDMNQAQARTLQQVRQVLAGTQVMEFQAAAGDAGRCAWIKTVLKRFDYRRLARADRGLVLACLQRLSGCSRARIKRMVAHRDAVKPLVKNYGASCCPSPIRPLVQACRCCAACGCGPCHWRAVGPRHDGGAPAVAP